MPNTTKNIYWDAHSKLLIVRPFNLALPPLQSLYPKHHKVQRLLHRWIFPYAIPVTIIFHVYDVTNTVRDSYVTGKSHLIFPFLPAKIIIALYYLAIVFKHLVPPITLGTILLPFGLPKGTDIYPTSPIFL